MSDSLSSNLGTQPNRATPSLPELLEIIKDAVLEIQSNYPDKPFTAHTVTEYARRANPNVQVDHEAVRTVLHDTAASVGDLAVIDGAFVGRNEARLYVPIVK